MPWEEQIQKMAAEQGKSFIKSMFHAQQANDFLNYIFFSKAISYLLYLLVLVLYYDVQSDPIRIQQPTARIKWNILMHNANDKASLHFLAKSKQASIYLLLIYFQLLNL